MGVFTSLCSNNLNSELREWSHCMWRHMWCPLQKQIWDLLSRPSGRLPGSGCQDTCVADKDITNSRNARIWTLSSPCLHCQQNLLVFPKLQSWEPGTCKSSNQAVQRGWKALNHCAVSALATELQALRRAQHQCPTPEITFQGVFQQDGWCLTDGRETTFILSAIQNLGDSILEPWVVRLEEQRKIVI